MPDSRSKAFCEVVEALAQAGQFEQALEVARQIEDASKAFMRRFMRWRWRWRRQGSLKQALEVARQIKDSDSRWWAVS
jgi:hypothetical protein